MFRMVCIAASAALLFSVDVPQIVRSQPPAANRSEAPSDKSLLIFPDYSDASVDSPSAASASSAPTPTVDQPSPTVSEPKPTGTLQEDSRMQILRFVDGEFARMLTPLPGSRKGFHSKAGEPLDQAALRKAIRASGAGVNTGDSVQITKLDFLPSGIIVELNGGGNAHKSWRDNIQMSVGVPVPMTTSTTTQDTRAPVGATAKTGATFYLDFNRPLPDLTPKQVKQYHSRIMDFSKQRSAAINWTDSLPPAMQDAIRDKRAIVGMDREEVQAAMGRPDRKVREQDAVGNDIEDWIYGHPPAPTTFVRFSGDKVAQIDQYK